MVAGLAELADKNHINQRSIYRKEQFLDTSDVIDVVLVGLMNRMVI